MGPQISNPQESNPFANVGGWTTNQWMKNMRTRQIGSFPPNIRGENKKWDLKPPAFEHVYCIPDLQVGYNPFTIIY